MSERPLPDLAHPLYGPHWAAAADERLSMQQCEACGEVRWPPEPVCPVCLTEGGRWTEVPGTGSIWSLAVYEHAYHEGLRSELPYTCVLVELDAGPRLISRFVGAAGETAEIWMRVTAVFPEVAPGVRLVCFAPGPPRVAAPD